MSDYTRKVAKELVEQMTMEEKMSQMLFESPAIERLGIPAYNWWNEALHGVARAGVATMFPQAIGLAASFDRNLLHKIGDVVSTEGRAKYNEFSGKGDRGIYKGLTFWAPNVNIFRDPRWGRGQETFGEDPYLTGELGVAYIKGLQGEDEDHLKVAACAKHYAVHSGPEALRHHFDAKVSKHDLYDTYLYAFKRCVKDGRVEAVMGAYNRVNGEPACGSKTLLKDILRKDWGFMGHVVSDCWAVKDFHENHHVTKSPVESVTMAVNNGCDLNCGCTYTFLGEAYEKNLVSKEAITEAVERLVEIRVRLGMIGGYSSPYQELGYDKVECKEHVEFAVETAKRCMTLLKNKEGILPLQKDKYKTIAVIGPNADSRRGLVGNYEGRSSQYITPLEGIRQYVKEDVNVLYSQGCHLYKDKVEGLGQKKDSFAEALIMAERADLVVLCMGLDAGIEGEEGDAGNEYASGDKLGLKLPGVQQELLEEITAVGKPVVLLLLAGSAIDLSWADEHVDAILDAWYPGARGGRAIAEVLFGEDSPGGKLPVTFYRETKELPDFEDYSMKNRTYRYAKGNILYPFGYGLTYSKVIYQNARVDRVVRDVLENVTLEVEVKNHGNYPVYESVQAYVKHMDAQEYEPFWQLKGVENIALQPGETKKAVITLTPRDFAIITEEGNCVVRPGEYILSIGGQQPDEISEKRMGRKVDTFQIVKTGEEKEIEY